MEFLEGRRFENKWMGSRIFPYRLNLEYVTLKLQTIDISRGMVLPKFFHLEA